MKVQLASRNFYLMFAMDMALFAVSLILSFLFRFEFFLPDYYRSQLLHFLPLFIATKAAIFLLFGLYRGMWRYTSFYELRALIYACFLSNLLLLAMVLFWKGFSGFPRSVFLIDALLTIFLTGGLRVMIRLHFEQGRGGVLAGLTALFASRSNAAACPARAVLIVGAGRAGEQILREMEKNPGLGLAAAGFLDDDNKKWGRAIHGVPVLGPVTDIGLHAAKLGVSEAFIALPEASGEKMRRIVELCEASGLGFKTLPSMGEILDGKVSIKALRDVNFQDLLGREQIDLEVDRISGYLKGRIVLVTGCGGSIGSELCRQIIRFSPKLLILFDAGEYNLYQIQMELHHERRFTDYVTILGNLRDRELVEQAFARFKPEVVFHAAAYKHVPLLEKNPWEAVHNNIVASRDLMAAAVRHRTARFVLVSTDKAVNPTNVMGASKRVTELILQSMTGGPTKFMAVRFGNVIGSSGSVIPLFLEQIRHGGPVTVTHPDVMRYFMTIMEAAQLILQAGSMGGEGELFILKMGIPVRIADMARDLIRLAGKEPDHDIRIEFTGLREGEKLTEELYTEGEGIVATSHEKIVELKLDGLRSAFPESENPSDRLDQAIDELVRLAGSFDGPGIKAGIKALVAEYAASEAPNVLEGRGQSA